MSFRYLSSKIHPSSVIGFLFGMRCPSNYVGDTVAIGMLTSDYQCLVMRDVDLGCYRNFKDGRGTLYISLF